tara:strand:+ start:756 stop:1835 length:1080 start_codon:yes stop_codon:yes gene_type:complete
MKIQIQWEFDLGHEDHPDYMQFHNDFAAEQGVPLVVDMCEFFDNPEEVSIDHITDALSDEYGWLVQDWYVLSTCNSDQDNIIINHQDQTINPLEDQMENSTISTPVSASIEENPMSVNDSTPTPTVNEDVMSQKDMIVQMFKNFLSEGGDPKVTAFKTHLNDLINGNVKPLCSRSGKAADGSDWRSVLKARFSGKGAKWVTVALSEINPTITQLEADGVNCDDYKTLIEHKGGAWIRFSGARLDSDGNQAAAFEVRTGGSTKDHPKQLHLIPISLLDETIRPMGGTPRSLKLEAAVKSEPEVSSDESDEIKVENDEAVTEVHPDSVIAVVSEPESLEEIFEDFMDDSVYDDDDLNDDIF